MTPELAAENAAKILDQANEHPFDAHEAAALVSIADGWTRLHTALANAPKQIEPGQVEPEPEQWNPYRERAALVAHLAALFPSAFVIGADPAEPDWPVIFVHTPHGQMSWHIAPDDLDLFGHVSSWPAEAADAPIWDGHTTAEKYERLHALTGDQAAKTIEFAPIGYLLVQGEGDYYELCAHGPDPIDRTPDRLRAVLAISRRRPAGQHVLCKLIPLDQPDEDDAYDRM